MNMYAHEKKIYIALWRPGRGWLPAGVILSNDEAGYAGFTYFQDYVDNDEPPLNPATLNYRDTGSRYFPIDLKKHSEGMDRTFWELLPSTGDFSAQIIISQFPEYKQLNKVGQLHRLGSRTVGGLSSYSDQQVDEISINSLDWLDAVRDEAVKFSMHEIMRVKHKNAFWAMASYGGVRPKATFKDENNRFWIAKFNLPTDPYDMAKAEALSLQLAGDAGLIVPETKVLTLNSGESVFLIERFDRNKHDRFHGLSLFALAPGIDLPKNTQQARLAGANAMAIMMRNFSDFKNMDTLYLMKKLMMDLAINNTDNHLRNVRVILDEMDKWTLSPIFDMFFNPRSQPHHISPTGLALADSYLDNSKALEGIGAQMGIHIDNIKAEASKVKNAVLNWEKRADTLNISTEDRHKIQRAIDLGIHGVEMTLKKDLAQRITAPVPHTAPKTTPIIQQPVHHPSVFRPPHS